MIKEVYLESEKEKIKKLLEENDLKQDDLIEKTFYFQDGDAIVGTVSLYKNIIKCLAVSQAFQNEGYAEKLVGEAIKYLQSQNIYHYMVYTKTKYEKVFISLNFSKIIQTDNVVLLEGGITNITKELNKIKKQIEGKFNIDVDQSDIACMVINGNPITNGHIRLLEEALKEHKYLILFLLEEDLSYFSFKERMAFAYLSTLPYKNVLCLPSTKYLVSSLTFPGYFLKTENEKNKEWAKVDAQVYQEYFQKILNIKKRYIGSEVKGYMQVYNETLKEILGEKITEVKRFDDISASNIRKLISEGKIEEALTDVPNGCKMLVRESIKQKHE